MRIQGVSSYSLYNNYSCQRKAVNNQLHSKPAFKGVGNDGLDLDFEELEEKRRVTENYNKLDDDRTLKEILFGPKKPKHKIDMSKIESLEEDPIPPRRTGTDDEDDYDYDENED